MPIPGSALRSSAGSDAINSIKQASEFGLSKNGQTLASLVIFLTDVHSIGLPIAQGLFLTSTFYWDLNEGTRAFADRFSRRMKNGAAPTMPQAGTYSGLLHYLKVVGAMGGDISDGPAVVRAIKDTPTDDPLFGKTRVRIDGRMLADVHLFQVKSPAESRGEWDLYKLVSTLPGEQGFRPLEEGGCPLANKR